MRLRPPVEGDARWIADAVGDPDIPRWTRVPHPYTKDDALSWIALAAGMQQAGSAYHLVVEDAESGARLGSAGLEVHAKPARHGEIGYWLAAPARGRGVATRAVRLLAGWALEAAALPVLEIHVLPRNERSHAVARRCGFAPAGTRLMPFRGRIEEFEVYARDATGAARSDRPGA